MPYGQELIIQKTRRAGREVLRPYGGNRPVLEDAAGGIQGDGGAGIGQIK